MSGDLINSKNKNLSLKKYINELGKKINIVKKSNKKTLIKRLLNKIKRH